MKSQSVQRLDGWQDEWMTRWMNDKMDEWQDGWMTRWMNDKTNEWQDKVTTAVSGSVVLHSNVTFYMEMISLSCYVLHVQTTYKNMKKTYWEGDKPVLRPRVRPVLCFGNQLLLTCRAQRVAQGFSSLWFPCSPHAPHMLPTCSPHAPHMLSTCFLQLLPQTTLVTTSINTASLNWVREILLGKWVEGMFTIELWPTDYPKTMHCRVSCWSCQLLLSCHFVLKLYRIQRCIPSVN